MNRDRMLRHNVVDRYFDANGKKLSDNHDSQCVVAELIALNAETLYAPVSVVHTTDEIYEAVEGAMGMKLGDDQRAYVRGRARQIGLDLRIEARKRIFAIANELIGNPKEV